MIDVFEAIRQSAYAYGVQKLAAKLGCQPGTLYNKLNNDESCSHHKLTLQDFIQITNITGDSKPLQSLAGLFDCALYCLPDVSNLSDDALLDIINHVHAQGGQAHAAMAAALADGNVSQAEYQNYARECREWLAAIVTLKRRFRGLVVMIDEQRTT